MNSLTWTIICVVLLGAAVLWLDAEMVQWSIDICSLNQSREYCANKLGL